MQNGADEFLGNYRLFERVNGALSSSTRNALGTPGSRPPKVPPAFKIDLEKFSLGYIKGGLFVSGYETELQKGFLSLDFSKQEVFARLVFSDEDTFKGPDMDCKVNVLDIENVYFKEARSGPKHKYCTLTIVLRRPPKFTADYRPYRDEGHQFAPLSALRRATEDDWNFSRMNTTRDGPLSVLPRDDSRKSHMKLGFWTAYRVTSVMNQKMREKVRVSLDRLRTFSREEEHDEDTDELIVNMDKDIVVSRTRIDATMNTIEDFLMREFRNNYTYEYLMLGLVSQGVIPPHHDSVGILTRRIARVFADEREGILSGLFRLGRLKDLQVEKQVANLEQGPTTEDKLPADRVYMRRVVVTPTRVVLHPPDIETSNRVIRAWPKHQDRFLRVSFADDDGAKLRIDHRLQGADKENPKVGVLHRVRCALKYGIHIGSRHYVFLAAGESQMKEHSCWMVSEDPERGFTADAIRKKMGDFSHIRIVAKYASRMGLCFSATRQVSMQLDIKRIPDIKFKYAPSGPRDKSSGKYYTYTDGIGRCSADLAKKCALALTGSQDITPSAVQIRLGGYKGVLAVHRDLECGTVQVRPSMEKFQCEDGQLGVMRIASHSHAHLNRQAISLLSHLGIPDHVFEGRMRKQIRDIKNISVNLHRLDDNTHQARKLYRFAELPVLQMLKAGFSTEPLLLNVLKCMECSLLQDLKYKARIQIEDGAFLMGIADEYNVLQPGEIYVAIQVPGQRRKVITGNCTIFRNPSLHPGDIQTAKAVDVDIFDEAYGHSLTNVVIFSTKLGPRDLQSKLAGGDLDGDYFTVIWDQAFQLGTVEEPMDYNAVPPRELDRDVTMDDVREFFVGKYFMTSDVLGMVSNIHLARSDKYDPSHEDCLQLAKLASDAVDFGKSGVPVELPPALMEDRDRPDFMLEHGYVSEKVLGSLYRMIIPPPKYEPDSSHHPLDDRLMKGAMTVRYLREAGRTKHRFDIELESLMRRHRMCEAELWGGVTVSGDQKKKRERDSAAKGPVKEAMEAIRRKFRRMAEDYVAPMGDINGMKNWAKAAYRVTRDKRSKAMYVDVHNESQRGTSASFRGSSTLSDNEMEEGEISVTRVDLISFSWVWAQELCEAVKEDLDIIKEEPDEDDEELLRDFDQAHEEDEAALLTFAIEDV